MHKSDDFKQDAHLVKLFSSKIIAVLKNVDMNKIIEFMDQVPLGIKSKPFYHLANTKIRHKIAFSE